ncbi:MAG: hypothetical protein Q8936_11185 [Bacillota bacterium]|nr:hypothetical protein [Bacillota bacterium]
MNNNVSIILRKLITENGTNLCRDSVRLKEMLTGLCEDSQKETNLILLALQQNIVQEILNAPENNISEELYFRLSAKLFNDFGIAKENSMWAVKAWVEALGKTVAYISSDVNIINQTTTQNNSIPISTNNSNTTYRNNKSISKILFGVFCIIIIFCIVIAIALNTHQSESVANDKKNTVSKNEIQTSKEAPADELDSKSFALAGTINKNLNIHMKLNFRKKEVTGSYYYDKYNQNISLKGTYDNYHNVKLTESDENSNITGIFTGKISTSGDFEGTWSAPNGSKQMPFSTSAKDTSDSSSTTASNSTENKNSESSATAESYTVMKDFDYSNRYIPKEYKGDDTKSNTGDSVTDSINDTGWAIFNSTQKVITNANNDIQKSYTVKWGFIPQTLTYDGNTIKIDGQFYNNNDYASISNIRNLVFSLVDSNNKIIGMYDFSKDSNISNITVPHNQTVPYSFTISNIPKAANLTNYATIICSDFNTIIDEEKMKRDHPDVYNATQYLNEQAAKDMEKMQEESLNYVDMVNSFAADRANDASKY